MLLPHYAKRNAYWLPWQRWAGGRSLRGCPVLAAGEGRVFPSFERTVCLHPPFRYSQGNDPVPGKDGEKRGAKAAVRHIRSNSSHQPRRGDRT